MNANKKIMLGIETVAKLMKGNNFYIAYDDCPRFRQEIYKYIWHKTKDEPKQEFDDVLDSRSEEHTSELQSRGHLVCRLLLEKKQRKHTNHPQVQHL